MTPSVDVGSFGKETGFTPTGVVRIFRYLGVFQHISLEIVAIVTLPATF